MALDARRDVVLAETFAFFFPAAGKFKMMLYLEILQCDIDALISNPGLKKYPRVCRIMLYILPVLPRHFPGLVVALLKTGSCQDWGLAALELS